MTSIALLGICFSNNKKTHYELNLLLKINEFSNCLNRWEKHGLSLTGKKIAVIKTIELPKLIYPLTVLENSKQELINKLNKYMFEFLWDDKLKLIVKQLYKTMKTVDLFKHIYYINKGRVG